MTSLPLLNKVCSETNDGKRYASVLCRFAGAPCAQDPRPQCQEPGAVHGPDKGSHLPFRKQRCCPAKIMNSTDVFSSWNSFLHGLYKLIIRQIIVHKDTFFVCFDQWEQVLPQGRVWKQISNLLLRQQDIVNPFAGINRTLFDIGFKHNKADIPAFPLTDNCCQILQISAKATSK